MSPACRPKGTSVIESFARLGRTLSLDGHFLQYWLTRYETIEPEPERYPHEVSRDGEVPKILLSYIEVIGG